MKLKLLHSYFLCFLFLMSQHIYTVPLNTVIATINVGTNPAGVAITPDSKFVYVANSTSNTVSVISVASNTVVATIGGFDTPYSITINPAGTLAYVTNSGTGLGQNTISVIDIPTNTVIDTIGGFLGPDGMVITPDGKFGYVANYGFPAIPTPGTTVSVVDLTTTNIVTNITVGQFVAAVAITPDGKFVYAANYNTGTAFDGTISVIDTSTNTVVQTITGFFGPYNIAITPNGKFAYVTNFGSNNFTPVGNTVSVVNLSTNLIVNSITVGTQPAGAAVTPDGSLLYVTNYNDQAGMPTGQGIVDVIYTVQNIVIPTISINVGQGPGAIAITPNGEYAYVSNYISNTVSVIGLQSFLIIAQGCKTKDEFLTQEDLINKLTWTAQGASLPVSYSIYRDITLTQLAATIPATEAAVFLDHNIDPNILYIYYIVGTNSVGVTSFPIPIIVTQNC